MTSAKNPSTFRRSRMLPVGIRVFAKIVFYRTALIDDDCPLPNIIQSAREFTENAGAIEVTHP